MVCYNIIEEILSKYFIMICKKMNNNNHFLDKYISKNIKPNRYEKIIFIRYQLTSFQIKKAVTLISLCFFFNIFILNYIFYLPIELYSLFFLFGIFLFNYLSNYFINKVEFKDNFNTSNYLFLILEIKYLLFENKIQDNFFVKIYNLIQSYENIAVNQRKTTLQINIGNNIEQELKNLYFFSPDFSDFFGKMLKLGKTLDLIKDIDELENNIKIRYKNQINKIDNLFPVFFIHNLFSPVIFVLISKIPPEPLDSLLFLAIFFLINKYFFNYFLNDKIGFLSKNNSLDNNIMKEYQMFITFLSNFISNLDIFNKENALIETLFDIDKYDRKFLGIGDDLFQDILFSKGNMINILFYNLKNPELRKSTKLFNEIFNYDTKTTQNILNKQLKMIKSHLKMSHSRDILINKIKTKLIIFKVLITIIFSTIPPIMILFRYNIKKLENILSNTTNLELKIDDLLFYYGLLYLFTVIFILKMFSNVYRNGIANNDLILTVFYVIIYYIICLSFLKMNFF